MREAVARYLRGRRCAGAAEDDKAQEALATGGPKTDDEEYARKRAIEDARDAAIAKTLPVPPRETMVCARGGKG